MTRRRGQDEDDKDKARTTRQQGRGDSGARNDSTLGRNGGDSARGRNDSASNDDGARNDSTRDRNDGARGDGARCHGASNDDGARNDSARGSMTVPAAMAPAMPVPATTSRTLPPK